MKIVHAVHRYPPEFEGGTERYVRALAEGQRARGHQVVVVAGTEEAGAPERRDEEIEGVRVVRLGRDPERERYGLDPHLPRLRSLFGGLLEEETPDIVHVHHWFLLGVGLVCEARQRGLPAVVTLHDFFALCPRFFLRRPDGGCCAQELPVPVDRCVECVAPEVGGTGERRAAVLGRRDRAFAAELEAASALLVPSEAVRETVLRFGRPQSRAASRIEVAPFGCFTEPTAQAPAEVRDSDPPPGTLRLLWFGRVEPGKGVGLLLEALERMEPAARRRLRLRLLGDGSDADHVTKIDEKAARLGVERVGRFDPARLAEEAARADLAVFPARLPETYGVVVDEARALRLGVVVSDAGALPERVGEAGVVVPAGDAAALARALERLAGDPAAVARLRRAAREGLARFDEHLERLDAVYRRAAGEAGEQPPGWLVADARIQIERLEEAAQGAPPEDPASGRFEPGARFPPLLPFDRVPGGRVVVVAPHPDDETIGAGGALALHARRGDDVVLVLLTDGARGGDPQRRLQEAEEAAGELGIRAIRRFGFPDGALEPSDPQLAALCGALESLEPDVLYVPSPFEDHHDHRAAVHLVLAALKRTGRTPWVVLYEVNEPQPPSYLLDVTPVAATKRRALERYASQRGRLDVVEKTLSAQRARTVNVDLPEVEAAEAFVALPAGALAGWIARAEEVRGFLARLPREAPAAARGRGEAPAGAADRSVAPVTCVISTWNKRDDVRENLLALRRQTMRPAEIVVVDNHSRDGTAEMIREEFPEVRLLVTDHDRYGACETFNMGFRAATQPFVAIMDDDVVAPPEWLERLYRRMLEEPETTAMVSSKVVEPGMPEEYLRSPAVNEERYASTFRGCGTLARRDVLLRAGGYDEVFFIYGNERDLAARILGLGYRILLYPGAEIFHKTPFGLKPGKRSLYYHVRNFWLYAFKNCSFGQIARAAWVLAAKGLGLRRGGEAVEATGTIGLDRSLKETPGGFFVAVRATLAALALLPYCLRHRRVCRHPDFEPPVQ